MIIVGKTAFRNIREMQKFGVKAREISASTFRSIADSSEAPDTDDPDSGLNTCWDERYVAISVEHVEAFEGLKKVLDNRGDF